MGSRIEPKFYAQILHQSIVFVCPVVRAKLKDCPIILVPGPTHTISLFYIIKIGKNLPNFEIVNY
jgi:hypothetical protein